MKRIPMLPLPIGVAKKISKPLIPISSKISKIFPSLGSNLIMLDFELTAAEYISIAMFSSIFWFLLINAISLTAEYSLTLPSKFLPIMFGVSFVIAMICFFYFTNYPKLLVNKRTREIDKSLLFALRHLLIQVKSGVPLFDSMVSVSRGNYGMVSEEFGKTVDKISTGISEVDALEEIIIRNPSLYFRRTIWQLSNAFRSGADLSRTLESIIANLSNEQKIEIRRYGSQLNPMAMMYMMISVIIPTLGVSFLIILSSFSGFPITKNTFWMILGIVTLFQFNFVGIIKSRRPSVEI